MSTDLKDCKFTSASFYYLFIILFVLYFLLWLNTKATKTISLVLNCRILTLLLLFTDKLKLVD